MINFDRVLEWYSGKSLAVMRSLVVPTLTEAIRLGHWQKGASRKVRAALNKQTVAIRWARDHERDLSDLGRGSAGLDHTRTGWSVTFAMGYGNFENAHACARLIADLRPIATPDQATLLDRAARWADDFAPVADAVRVLDISRPAPAYEFAQISPTVAANVGRSLGVDFQTIRAPEIRYTWMEMIVSGKAVRVMVGEVVWPDGTRHGLSRFSASGSQCEACGHGIRSAHNWVPLLVDASHPKHGKVPASLWVGRDCAGRLFGVRATGDALYPERTGS